MLKNKIILTFIFLTLSIPCYSEDEFVQQQSENSVAAENLIQKDIQESSPYKKPHGKRKIIKKFLTAMFAVFASSVILYGSLAVYNRVRNGLTNSDSEENENVESSLDTPETLSDAVKTFVDKTNWEN